MNEVTCADCKYCKKFLKVWRVKRTFAKKSVMLLLIYIKFVLSG